ncbi:MAG: hypothetical protein RR324_01360 [Cellulosilyticaceae bacterium]
MGTITDKLTYLVETKSRIKTSIFNKGQPIDDTTKFRDYNTKIDAITTGGGGTGLAPVLSLIDVKATQASIGSDVAFDTSVLPTDFTLPGNSISTVTKVSALQVNVVFASALSTSTILSVLSSAFLNDHGGSSILLDLSTVTLASYFGVSAGMYKVDFASDDGSTTQMIPAVGSPFATGYANRPTNWKWKVANTDITNLVISGNSFIALNGSYNIYCNQRDNYSEAYLVDFGAVGNLAFLKCTWRGWAPYNQRDASTYFQFEVYLLSNGDAVIYWIDNGASMAGGTYSFMGLGFTISKASPVVSFYRQLVAGSAATDWKAVVGNYDINQSLNLI